MAITALSLNVPGDKNIKDWSLRVPKLALKHPSLLYAIYALAALHLSRVEPDEPSYYQIYQRYLALTLRDHRADVGNLNKDNTDAALITSSYLRVCTFAALTDREIIPYTAPKEWLSMANTSGYSLAVSVWQLIADDENAITRSMLSNAPGLKPSGQVRDDASLFMDFNRQGLEYLLHRTPNNVLREPWDNVSQEAYKTTLSVIGAVKLAIAAKDPRAQILRRLIIFPTVLETAFITLVNSEAPRALVVLAHYFALLADFRDIWYIGNIGKREVRGNNSALPEEWRDLMPMIPSNST